MITKRRPGEPTPPRPLTDNELASAPIDSLTDSRDQHEQWLGRLERDPGRDLPPDEAFEARSQRLAELERHTEQLIRLDAAIEVREAHIQADAGFAARIKRAALRQAASDGSDEEFLAELHESMRERERESDAKAALRELADRRSRPPRPESRSIAAAVLSSPDVIDLLRRRMRTAVERDEFGATRDVVSAEPVLDTDDLAVLAIVLHLLSEHDPLVIPVTSEGGRWPSGSDLPPFGPGGLLARVRHLAANGLLAIEPTENGSGRTVTAGPTALAIARSAGVTV